MPQLKTIRQHPKKGIKMVEILEGKISGEQLKSLGLFSLEKRRLRGNLIVAYSTSKERTRGGSADLSSLRDLLLSVCMACSSAGFGV